MDSKNIALFGCVGIVFIGSICVGRIMQFLISIQPNVATCHVKQCVVSVVDVSCVDILPNDHIIDTGLYLIHIERAGKSGHCVYSFSDVYFNVLTFRNACEDRLKTQPGRRLRIQSLL